MLQARALILKTNLVTMGATVAIVTLERGYGLEPKQAQSIMLTMCGLLPASVILVFLRLEGCNMVMFGQVLEDHRQARLPATLLRILSPVLVWVPNRLSASWTTIRLIQVDTLPRA